MLLPAELQLLGVSFRTADEVVREGLAFSPADIGALLGRVRSELPGTEAVVLSTCNRTEVYAAGPADLLTRWHALLRHVRPEAPALDVAVTRYERRGADAFRHLTRVVCGLDSALLGDSQIAGQVRRAVALAGDAGTLGGVLSPAFAAAQRAGKQARAVTDIGRGAPGVGSAVAEALRARGVKPDAPVLVLGTGEAARAVLRALSKAGRAPLLVSGRRADATEELARRTGARPVAWDVREEVVRTATVVVVATAAHEPVLIEVPSPGPALVVDAGFPRQVGAGLTAEVVSLLGLTQVADEAAQARLAAVPAVEALVAEHVAQWQLARDRAPIEAAIKDLHLAAAQAARAASRSLAEETGVAAEVVERHLVRQVRRVLHGHVTALRALPAGQ